MTLSNSQFTTLNTKVIIADITLKLVHFILLDRTDQAKAENQITQAEQ